MKKLVLVSLVIAAVVAFTASDAMAYRYFGGSYTIGTGGMYGSGSPWFGDSGSGPHPYTAESSSALSDGVVTIAETQQLMSVNPAQVAFADPAPGDKAGPGGTDMWWGSTGNDRFNAFFVDLGAEVEIDAIAGILNKRHSPSQINLQWFRVAASHTGVSYPDTIISEEPYPDNGYNKYTNIGVRPSTIPIGLFRNLSTGVYDVDTVTYRYLRIEISHNGDGDSTGLSELVIDAVPEPATILMLVGGGLFGLLRRKS
jgi:hypothetical protein